MIVTPWLTAVADTQPFWRYGAVKNKFSWPKCSIISKKYKYNQQSLYIAKLNSHHQIKQTKVNWTCRSRWSRRRFKSMLFNLLTRTGWLAEMHSSSSTSLNVRPWSFCSAGRPDCIVPHDGEPGVQGTDGRFACLPAGRERTTGLRVQNKGFLCGPLPKLTVVRASKFCACASVSFPTYFPAGRRP